MCITSAVIFNWQCPVPTKMLDFLFIKYAQVDLLLKVTQSCKNVKIINDIENNSAVEIVLPYLK